jgi:hypothetical protein
LFVFLFLEGNPGSLSNPPENLLFRKVINLIPKGGYAPLTPLPAV